MRRRYLGVSDDTVRRWIDSGPLPATVDQAGRKVVDGYERRDGRPRQPRVAAAVPGAWRARHGTASSVWSRTSGPTR